MANLHQQNFYILETLHPNNVPEEAMKTLRVRCWKQATQQVHTIMDLGNSHKLEETWHRVLLQLVFL